MAAPAADISRRPQPHVLVIPWPAVGHINPMMRLSTVLSAAGVSVTFVNTQFHHRRLVRALQQKNGAATPAEIPDVVQLDQIFGEYHEYAEKPAVAPIRLIGIPDGVSDEDYVVMNFPRISGCLSHWIVRVVAFAQSLSPPLTSVISDVFNVWTESVGESLAIPHVGFWTQSAASFAAHVFFAENPNYFKELMMMDADMESRPIVGIPGCPTLKPADVASILQCCDTYNFFFHRLTQTLNFGMPRHSHLLLNTFEQLEPEALAFVKGLRKNVMEIGPLLPAKHTSEDGRRISLWTEDGSCMEWLDRQMEKSVLYVSFGSFAQLSEAEVAELAAGLEASGCRILMVARRALANGKDAVFPESFAMSDMVRLVEWAPQLEVLAHPSVGGFLTHAGWNSTTEAISNGVPMICWPVGGDQMMNCRGIVDYWKLGLHLEKDRSSGLVEQMEIERKVKLLMDPASSKDIRKRALELSIQARECHLNSSEANLQSLLRFLLDSSILDSYGKLSI